jgi:hypothetical protein
MAQIAMIVALVPLIVAMTALTGVATGATAMTGKIVVMIARGSQGMTVPKSLSFHVI